VAEQSTGPDGRVWRAVPAPARYALEDGLPPTDLQTLLLSVARSRARAVTPARLLRRWREDRFVRPAAVDPRVLVPVEAALWRLLPDRYAGVELSPVAPLGTCSALGPVDQNRVLSTVRGTEVVSDPTNALAIEAADRRRGQPAAGRVDLAGCQRVLRAQPFPAGWSAHFRLFALVSTARDTGCGRTEAALFVEHLTYWQRVLAELLPGVPARITVTAYHGGVLAERLRDTVLPALSGGPVPVVEDPERTHAAGYYRGAALGLRAVGTGGDLLDIGDGGLTDWTARLLGDAKERCLVSCVSTERLAAAAGGVPR
jgi:hypothetical protein